MAKALTIKVKSRENKKPNALRTSGYIPATVYGHSFDSMSVQVSTKEFSKIPHKAYSHINELDVEGQEKFPILIRNVQTDPVRDTYLNIEFYKIKSDEKIKVKVSLNYTGHSPAVLAGGVLIVSFNEIEIQCLPKDIPDVIDVELEQIKEIGQAIHPKDLKVSENITILAKGDEVLAKVEVPKTHEIEEEKPAVAAEAVPGAATAAPLEGAAPAATPGKEAAAPQAGKPAAATKAAESKPAKGKEK